MRVPCSRRRALFKMCTLAGPFPLGTVEVGATLEVEQDTQLLGGLVAQVGDLVFDGSLRTQLQQLRAGLGELRLKPAKNTQNRLAFRLRVNARESTPMRHQSLRKRWASIRNLPSMLYWRRDWGRPGGR